MSIKQVEIDVEYMLRLEQYINDLRQENLDYIEYTNEEIRLIPAEDLVCYKIRYRSSDYAQVIGYICAPKDYLDIEYPVLIYNRGGNGDFSALTGKEVQYCAQFGFIVFASQYRGVDGGTGIERFGGIDIDDVVKLIDYAEKLPFTNNEIYMLGWSRGAMQTYITLSRDNRITAAVAVAGPTDLFKHYKESDDNMRYVYNLRVGSPETDSEEYEARSVMFWPNKIDTPLFLAHGVDDERIMAHHSTDLYDVMVKLNKEVKLMLYPDMDHSKPFYVFMSDYLYWLKLY